MEATPSTCQLHYTGNNNVYTKDNVDDKLIFYFNGWLVLMASGGLQDLYNCNWEINEGPLYIHYLIIKENMSYNISTKMIDRLK